MCLMWLKLSTANVKQSAICASVAKISKAPPPSKANQPYVPYVVQKEHSESNSKAQILMCLNGIKNKRSAPFTPLTFSSTTHTNLVVSPHNLPPPLPKKNHGKTSLRSHRPHPYRKPPQRLQKKIHR